MGLAPRVNVSPGLTPYGWRLPSFAQPLVEGDVAPGRRRVRATSVSATRVKAVSVSAPQSDTVVIARPCTVVQQCIPKVEVSLAPERSRSSSPELWTDGPEVNVCYTIEPEIPTLEVRIPSFVAHLVPLSFIHS